MFVITVVSFLIPIVNTIVNPHPFQKDSYIQAKTNGWDHYTILTTRATQYLTLYAQFWIIIGMYCMTSTTMFIAQTISWFVFCLYHGINNIDKKYLAYHSEELVNEVVSWKPPKDLQHKIIWFGLHWQHTFFPFYLHYFAYKNNISYNNNFYAVVCSYVVIGLYVVLHLFCWKVQGIAAYPFMNRLRAISHEMSFYCMGFMLFTLITCVTSSMWIEFTFYIMGILNMIMINHIIIKTF